MAVYLLHFERPIGRPQDEATRLAHGHGPRVSDKPYRAHARHYLGSAPDLDCRLRQHYAGNGASARLLAAAKERGVSWALARVWKVHDGPCHLNSRGQCDECRRFEARLKTRKNSPRFCPICRGELAFETWAPTTKARRNDDDLPF